MLTRLKIDASRASFLPDTRKWLQVSVLTISLVMCLTSFSASLESEHFSIAMWSRRTRCAIGLEAGTRDGSARLAHNQVEVTNTRNYPQWRSERWGIEENARRNESIKFITRDTKGWTKSRIYRISLQRTLDCINLSKRLLADRTVCD